MMPEVHRDRKQFSNINRDALHEEGAFIQESSTRGGSAFNKFEAYVAKPVDRKGSQNDVRKVPDMCSWATGLGVGIDNSKTPKRDRRRMELKEAGCSLVPGNWAPMSSTCAREGDLGAAYIPQPSLSQKKRGSFNQGRRRTPTPEVAALDGFLSELHDRLCSVEGGGVKDSTFPANSSSICGDGGPVGARVAAKISGAEPSESTDMYGVPHTIMADAEEVCPRYLRVE